MQDMTTRPPRRRADDNRFSRSVRGRVIIAALGLVTTLAASYGAGLKGADDHQLDLRARIEAQEQEITGLKVRQTEQYNAILLRINDTREDIRGTRADLNGIRDEIMRILRSPAR